LITSKISAPSRGDCKDGRAKHFQENFDAYDGVNSEALKDWEKIDGTMKRETEVNS